MATSTNSSRPVATWVRNFSGPTELRERFADGDNLMVIGRNSGSGGKAAYQMAVDDLHGAVKGLIPFGVDLMPLLPSKAELVQRLREAKPVKSVTPDGRAFTNRFVVLDFLLGFQVRFLLSAGTAKKLTDEGLQPFVTEMAAHIRAIQPALVFGKRIDRHSRVAWGLAPAMIALNGCHGWLGDTRRGLLPVTGLSSAVIFFDAIAGEEQAEKMPAQSIGGKREHTGKVMKNGRVPWGMSPPVPAGFARMRLKDGAGAGRAILVLDQAECLPPAAEVAYGRPAVFDDEGNHVDQVANVRFALKHLGLPGWQLTDIAEKLCERRYSTDKLRQQRGADAFCSIGSGPNAARNASAMLRALLGNIDLYETGVLKVELGPGEEPHTITDCFPLDGPWAKEADFERIRAWQSGRAEWQDRFVHTTFAGLHLKVDGIEAVLHSRRAAPSERPDEGPAAGELHADGENYVAFRRDDEVDSALLKRVPDRFVLPHRELAAMIVEGVCTAADEGMYLLEPDTSAIDDQLIGLKARRREAQARVQVLSEEAETLLNRALETTEDGRPRLSGALLERVNVRYNKLSDSLVPEAQRLVRHIEQEIEGLKDQHRQSSAAVTHQQLLELLASLDDPTNRRYRDLWLMSLRDLEVNRRVERDGQRRHVDYHARARLVVADGSDELVAEVVRRWSTTTGSSIDEMAQQAIERMEQGVWLGTRPRGDHFNALRKRVAEMLSRDQRKFWVGFCQGPRLLKVAMAAVHVHPELDAAELAEMLGEPVVLIERVRSEYGLPQTGRSWCRRPKTLLPEALALAFRNDGMLRYADAIPAVTTARATLSVNLKIHPTASLWKTVRDVGYYFTYRCDCSPEPTLMLVPRLREIDALVCSVCRSDLSGVPWPADPYDRYLYLPNGYSTRP